MSEILAIRLNNEPTETIPWIVWSTSSQQLIASGDADNLMQLSSYSKDREVVILADSAEITLMSVNIPPGSARHLDNVLPFLLEDDLAQDVSQVHISLLAKEGDTAFVAIVEHKIIQSWLASLSLAGMTSRRIIPDCLCLPYEEGSFTAALLNERWVIRTANAKGFAAEDAWLPMMLKGMQEHDELPPIVSHSPVPANSEFEWKANPPVLVMQLLAEGIKGNNFNLLTGRYKVSNQFNKYLRYWRDAAIVFVVLFSVLAIEQIIQTHRMETQTKEISALIRQEVAKVMPQNQRIPNNTYLRRILNDEVTRLSGGNIDASLLKELNDLNPMLKASSNIQLSTLRYDMDGNEIRLSARGTDFADFEKLRSAFADQFETELGQLNRDNNVVTGNFVLKRNSQ